MSDTPSRDELLFFAAMVAIIALLLIAGTGCAAMEQQPTPTDPLTATSQPTQTATNTPTVKSSATITQTGTATATGTREIRLQDKTIKVK